MDDERESTRCGKFGYEIFNERITIPYIFRATEKCCATKIFSWHFEKLNTKLKSNLIDFGYLNGYEMHYKEAELMNEINQWHNDSLYPYTFYRNDTLLKLDDVRDIFKYIDECEKKLNSSTQLQMASANMARLRLSTSNQDVILPYVIKNSQRWVPVHILFASNTVPPTLDCITLTGIDVMYMRFLLDFLKIKITSQTYEIPCVNLDGFMKHLIANGVGHYAYDDNFWPSKENIQPNNVNNKLPFFANTLKNNNLANQPKVTVKRKRDIPSVESKPAIESKKSKPEEPVIESKKSKQEKPAIEAKKSEQEKPAIDSKKSNPKKPAIESKETKNVEPKKPMEKNKKNLKTTTSKSKKKGAMYAVDKLVNYKREKNGKEYVLVRWKGYSSADDTWEPVESLNNNLYLDVNPLRKKWASKASANKK